MSMSLDEDEILNIAVTEHATRSRRTKENATKKRNGKKVNFVERGKKEQSHFPSEVPVSSAPTVKSGGKKVNFVEKGKKEQSHFPSEAPVSSAPTVKSGGKKVNFVEKGKKEQSHIPSEAPASSAPSVVNSGKKVNSVEKGKKEQSQIPSEAPVSLAPSVVSSGKKVNFVEKGKKEQNHFPSEAPVSLAPSVVSSGKKVNFVEKGKKEQTKDKGKKSSEKSSSFPSEAPVLSAPTGKKVAEKGKKEQSRDKGKKSSGKSDNFPSEAPVLSVPTIMPAQTVNLFEDGENSEKDGLISTVDSDSGSDSETDDLYGIVTCGDTPEEIVEYELSYMYDLQVGSQLEAQEIILSIEREMLNSMKESFLSCGESSRRRLSSVVGISALPRDQLSGTCGNNCISVDGGVTFYLNEASELSENRCDLKSSMVEIMNGIESNNDATNSMTFIETEVLDCEVSPVDSTRVGDVDQATAMSNAEKGLPSAAIGVIAIASVLTVAVAVFLTRRTRRRVGVVNIDNKNHDDASSILTPVTRGSPTRSSPTRSIQEANSVASIESSESNSDSNPPPISRRSAKSIHDEIQNCHMDENIAISQNGDSAVVIASTSAEVAASEASHEVSKEANAENNSIEKCLENLVKEEDSSYVTPFVTEVDDDSVDTTATSNISPQKQGKTFEEDNSSACTAKISNKSPTSVEEKNSSKVDELQRSLSVLAELQAS